MYFHRASPRQSWRSDEQVELPPIRSARPASYLRTLAVRSSGAGRGLPLGEPSGCKVRVCLTLPSAHDAQSTCPIGLVDGRQHHPNGTGIDVPGRASDPWRPVRVQGNELHCLTFGPRIPLQFDALVLGHDADGVADGRELSPVPIPIGAEGARMSAPKRMAMRTACPSLR
jgi:hypothetical protein